MANLLKYLMHEACCNACEQGDGCETGDRMGRKAFAYELVIGEEDEAEKTGVHAPFRRRESEREASANTALKKAGWVPLDPDESYWTHSSSGEVVARDVALSKARVGESKKLRMIVREMISLTEFNPQPETPATTDDDVEEVAPPGREKQVKALKKKGVRNPWAVSWASYNKSKKKR